MNGLDDLSNLSPELGQKYELLRAIIAEEQSVVVAFSGGVDSTLLLKVSVMVLGTNATAVIARSASYPASELREALKIADMFNVRVEIIDTDELSKSEYRANKGDRCYHCKSSLFDITKMAMETRQFSGTLYYGAIMDDLGDYRPGMQAALERKVRAPLIEAGLTKKEVRELSKVLDLPTWDKPATACLASRFPDGISVSEEALHQIGRCEARLSVLGLKVFRARYHGLLVRIELGATEQQRIWNEPTIRDQIVEACKNVGFSYVTIDLEGYRSGSGNLVQLS